jgi:hypothetical protein
MRLRSSNLELNFFTNFMGCSPGRLKGKLAKPHCQAATASISQSSHRTELNASVRFTKARQPGGSDQVDNCSSWKRASHLFKLRQLDVEALAKLTTMRQAAD